MKRSLSSVGLLVALFFPISVGGAPGITEWERPLDLASLPPLQTNLGGEAGLDWRYANSVLGNEVWILDSSPDASKSDAFVAHPELLKVPLTETGWPKELPVGKTVTLSTYYARKGAQKYEGVTGLFIVTWKGRTLSDSRNNNQFQVLDTVNDGNPQKGTRILPAGEHRVLAWVRSKDRGVQIRYQRPDPEDPIRDIKIWTPLEDGAGLELLGKRYNEETMGPGRLKEWSTEPGPGESEPLWHPRYIQHLREDPSGVLRFMAWQQINDLDKAAPLNWADRLTPKQTLTSLVGISPANYHRHPLPTWKGRGGLPVEWMIDLARTTGKDLWVQVPHTATDDYTAGLARALATGLPSGRRVWFEVSNELWNNASSYRPQYEAADRVGRSAGQSQGWGSGRIQGLGLRTFEEAWRAAGRSDHELINVVAGFAVSSDYNAQVLAGVKSVAPRLAEVMAITTYFGAELTEKLYTLPFGDGQPGAAVFTEAREVVRDSIYRTFPAWEATGRLCRDAGIGMIAYEGGSHILALGRGDWSNPSHAAFMRFLANLHRNTVMADLYREHWALWRAAGGLTASLFVDIGTHGFFGYWGAKEDVTQSAADAPRWRAAQEFVKLAARWQPLQEAGPRFTGPASYRAETGRPFQAELNLSAGPPVAAVEVAGGRLPEGIALVKSGTTWTLAGTPRGPESARAVLVARDAQGRVGFQVTRIEVDPGGAAAGGLVLFEPKNAPAAPLARSEGREIYRTRFDSTREFRRDQTGENSRVYLPFDAAQPLFSRHYVDPSVVLTPRSPLAPSGGWSLTLLGKEFREQNTKADGGLPVVLDPAKQSTGVWFGLRGQTLAGRVGSSLDLPADSKHPNPRRFGIPTIFDALVVWRRDQFQRPGPAAVGFGAGPGESSLTLDITDMGSDQVDLRFVVRTKDAQGNPHYFLSEAVRQDPSPGRFTLTDFHASSVPGKRWAEFLPSPQSVAMPEAASLTFRAMDLSDVDGIGFALRAKRAGWHYDLGFSRFLAVGKP